MATLLKQSTAVEIKLGPFVDNVDGFTPETALTITQADVRLAKNDGDWAQKNEATSLVHEENGWYRCLLDATDTNTLGLLIVAVNESGALPVWREFMVLAANVYDSLVAVSDLLQVDAQQLLGTAFATPTVAGVQEVDITHWRGTAITAGRLSTAQAGAASTITLDAGASAVDSAYNGMWIVIVGGTGVGQARGITAYVGATKVATISPNWTTNPAADSIFALFNAVS